MVRCDDAWRVGFAGAEFVGPPIHAANEHALCDY